MVRSYLPRTTDQNRGTVLVVEDEQRLAALIGQALARAGYAVDLAHDGHTGLAAARTGTYDVVLLDIMLPGLSGYRVLQALRDAGVAAAVIMVTAKDGEYDEIDALDIGADDYITKPFSVPVLLARISAALRRSPSAVLEVDGLRLESGPHRVTHQERVLEVSAREFAVLEYLMRRAGIAVRKQDLLDEVWNEPYGDPNLVEACMSSLRRKVAPAVIHTVRGVGYRIGGPAA